MHLQVHRVLTYLELLLCIYRYTVFWRTHCFYAFTGTPCFDVLRNVFRLARDVSNVLSNVFRLARDVSNVLSNVFRLARDVSNVLSNAFRLARDVSNVLSNAFRFCQEMFLTYFAMHFVLSRDVSNVLNNVFSLARGASVYWQVHRVITYWAMYFVW